MPITTPVWDTKNHCWIRFVTDDTDGHLVDIQNAIPDAKAPQWVGSWQSILAWPNPPAWVVYAENQKMEYRIVPHASLMRRQQVVSTLIGSRIRIARLTKEGDWQLEGIRDFKRDPGEEIPSLRASTNEEKLHYVAQPIFYDDELEAWRPPKRPINVLVFFKKNMASFFSPLHEEQKDYATTFILETALLVLRRKVLTQREYCAVLQQVIDAVDRGVSLSLPHAHGLWKSITDDLARSTTLTAHDKVWVSPENYPLVRAQMRAWIVGAIRAELQSLSFNPAAVEKRAPAIVELIHRQNIQKTIMQPTVSEAKMPWLYFSEHQRTMDEWEALIKNPIVNSLQPFKDFLAYRWERIKGTDLSYPHAIDHPTSQFCFILAQALSKLEGGGTKEILSLLMPTVEQLEDNIVPIDAKAELCAQLRQFVISDDYKRTIYVETSLNGMSQDGILRHTSPSYEPLNKEEQKRVIHHSSYSKAYYDASKALVDAKTIVPSLGASLNVFRMQLLAGSKKGDRGGTETIASDPAIAACRAFEVFFNNLHPEDQKELSNASAYGLSRNFGTLWRQLRLNAGIVTPTLEDEKIFQDVQRNYGSYCADTLAGNIKQIIEENKLYDKALRDSKSSLPNCTMLELVRDDQEKLFSRALASGDSYKIGLPYGDLELMPRVIKNVKELNDFCRSGHVELHKIIKEISFLRSLIHSMQDLWELFVIFRYLPRENILRDLFPPSEALLLKKLINNTEDLLTYLTFFPSEERLTYLIAIKKIRNFPESFMELLSVLFYLPRKDAEKHFKNYTDKRHLQHLITNWLSRSFIQDFSRFSSPIAFRAISILFLRIVDQADMFLALSPETLKEIIDFFSKGGNGVTVNQLEETITSFSAKGREDFICICGEPGYRFFSLLSPIELENVLHRIGREKSHVFFEQDGHFDADRLCYILRLLPDADSRSRVLAMIYPGKSFLSRIDRSDNLRAILQLLSPGYLQECSAMFAGQLHTTGCLSPVLYNDAMKPWRCPSWPAAPYLNILSVYKSKFLKELIRNPSDLINLLTDLPSEEEQINFISRMDDNAFKHISKFFKTRDDLLNVIACCSGTKVLNELCRRMDQALPAILFAGESVEKTLAYLREWQQDKKIQRDPKAVHKDLVRATLLAYKTRRREDTRKYTSGWGRLFGSSRTQKLDAADTLSNTISLKLSSMPEPRMFSRAVKTGDLGKIYEEAYYQFNKPK